LIVVVVVVVNETNLLCSWTTDDVASSINRQ